MPQPSAPPSLRRFFDRVVHRSFGDLALGDDPAADYLSDLLTRERELRRHIGDYTLFMTGLFRERVERLSIPGSYIREGQRSDRFEGYISALNYMRKGYVRPEHGTPDLPFFRRLVTEW